jgi:hypothetical protein
MLETGNKSAHNLPCQFAVDDVAPTSATIPTEPLRDHVAKRFRREVIFLPAAERPVANARLRLLDWQGSTARARESLAEHAVSRCHPLIDAVATAYSEHRPLTLSPDAIWLAVEQGFACHVAENAGALRRRIVRHEGTRGLIAEILDTSPRSIQLAVTELSAQIRKASDPVLHETLICDFSTTTPEIRTASEVVLMDCYSSYFTYSMMCVCGIPSITLQGSLEDWQRIRARVEVLATFGLEWWTARLCPILDEFVRTLEGRPSLPFWQAIYKPKKAYGTDTVTGWIADLFPYLGDAPERRRNHVFESDRKDWAIPVEAGVKTSFGGEPGADKGVAPRSFSSGLSSVPVKLSFPFEERPQKEFDLVAGFFGIEQDPVNLALSPIISWSITERPPEKPILIW